MPSIVLNVILLHPHKNPGWGHVFYPRFQGEDSEAQGG